MKVINVELPEGYVPPTLDVRKEFVARELKERVIRLIDGNIRLKYPRYDDYLDVEATASSPVAPAEWKAEAIAIAEWFYAIFQQLEAKEAEIMAMTTDEELNAFNIQEWIESLPAIPQGQ